MPMMTGARFMAETLNGYGVTSVFFVPAILGEALVEMEKLGIKRVNCHTEKAAAYMADGYARASRRPGIALAQSVGAANLAAGLQDAYLALSPVIAITGRSPTLSRHRHAYQEIDHWPMFEPVTKFNASVDGVEQLPFFLRQAFREATSGAPAPVHLDLMGITGEAVTGSEADLDVVIETSFASCPAARTAPEAEQVRHAAARLAQADRPVLVAGGGATASQAGPEIVELAEELSMPVATSLSAKGIIPEDHPLSVGVAGTYSRRCANEVVCEADLVLFVGSRADGQVTHFWQVPKPGIATIQIDIDPAQIGRNYPTQVALVGDAKVTVRRLIEALEPTVPKPDWTAWTRQKVAEWRAEALPRLSSNAEPILPERLCHEITDWLPADAILVSDTGHAGIWTGTMIEITRPGQSYLRCAGSLGWAFPAALGAKCAAPERPVVCFTGDGGFWYHLSEIETAVRCGINTVTVINNNHSLNQYRGGVRHAYGDQTAGSPEEMWVFQDVDFADIARSMGAFGVRVDSPADIQSALAQALASGGPAVVDVVSDIDAVAGPPFVPE